MNDLAIHDRNDAINRVRQDNRTGNRDMENPQKHRLRRRWGGRLFALGGLLLLAGGLSLGAWGNYSQQQEVMAIAKQERDFVPILRVATVEASPATVFIDNFRSRPDPTFGQIPVLLILHRQRPAL
jgi:hypothetical protein